MRFNAQEGSATLTTDTFDFTSGVIALVRCDREHEKGAVSYPIVRRAKGTEMLDSEDAAAVILKVGSIAAGENPAELHYQVRAGHALERIAGDPVARQFFESEVEVAWAKVFPDEPMPPVESAAA